MHRPAPSTALLAALLLTACGEAEGPRDAGHVCQDCGRDGGRPPDAGPGDAGPPSSDAAVGAACSFNRECAAAQRCERDPASGCACAVGPRGLGRGGVDPCADGNDCASALCVEGSDGSFYCSDECATDADCEGALPRCLDVALVGRVCVRIPPDGGA